MIALVAHDAGGAELVAHYALRERVDALATVEGPAVRVFERLQVPATSVALERAVREASWMLCGTSWQSDLEWRAMTMARDAGTRVVAFLDHWTQFADRFVRHGQTIRPDEVWVIDELAADIARRSLGDVPVVVAGNLHLDSLEAEARVRGWSSVSRFDARVILMVPEATSAHALARHGDARYFGYTELDAARYFVAHAAAAFPSIERIIVRPHPAEPADKYAWLQALSPWPISIETAPSLLDHLLMADAVAGCNTMAMVAALRLGRPVISYIPPAGPPCVLPHQDILMLRDLVDGPRRPA